MEFFKAHFKDFIDGVAVLNVIGVLTQLIPVVAGVFTIVWGYYRVKDIKLSLKIKQATLDKLGEE
jgi:hypothetical protein